MEVSQMLSEEEDTAALQAWEAAEILRAIAIKILATVRI